MFKLRLGGQIGLEGRELRIREEAFWEEWRGTHSWKHEMHGQWQSVPE